MQLRGYQAQAEQQVYAAWANGVKNVLVQLHTGAGKTVLFSKIIADNIGPAIAVAHRVELVSQISLTLAKYHIRHSLIAQKAAVRRIVSLHMAELGRSFYDPQSRITVAGVDTLVKLKAGDHPWFNKVSLLVQDEGHHVLRANKWGNVAALFPAARGLYLTATPVRADGRGLGRHADGLIDALVVGPPMRDLITTGFLSEYRVVAAPSDLDLSQVTISAAGDYSPPKLRSAVHKSRITGDVVSHYLKFAAGKLGVTFAVDVEAATEIAASFRAAGVSAEVISSKTPDLLRASVMRQFEQRKILQLVNVDLLGEGVNVPAIEVVSMARPTQSYGLYSQQFGRALRPLEGKDRAIIIDHVGNVMRHGLPDAARSWSLDRRERTSRGTTAAIIQVRTCLNQECLSVYERYYKKCPFCGFYTPPAVRSSPEFVDGDLLELDDEALARLRGEIKRVDGDPKVPQNLAPYIQRGITNRHLERQQAQAGLRDNIALWAGHQKQLNLDDSEIYRRFYFLFNIDVATAQTLNTKDATELNSKIIQEIIR